MNKLVFVFAAAALLFLAATLLIPRSPSPRPPAASAAAHEKMPSADSPDFPEADLAERSSGVDLAAPLARLLTELRAGAGDSSRGARHADLLRETKRAALSGEPSSAARAIVAALESGEDAPTGLGFLVGAGGAMSETPTYRTALLDLLGLVDPRAAARHARDLLRDPAVSPDEYAIALRNLANGPREEFPVDELRSAFAAMLAREDWRSAPTNGFLEAFDAAVESSAFAEIAPLINDPGDAAESPVGRAAFIAADRIMLSDPPSVVAAFRGDPQILASAPFHRASLLSRLDVREPAQQTLLRDYLLRSDHAPGELDYFLDVFPNGNAFVGYTLITRGAVAGPDMAAISRLDAATANTLRSWISQPAFAARADELRRVLSRLTEPAASVR